MQVKILNQTNTEDTTVIQLLAGSNEVEYEVTITSDDEVYIEQISRRPLPYSNGPLGKAIMAALAESNSRQPRVQVLEVGTLSDPLCPTCGATTDLVSILGGDPVRACKEHGRI